jgi:hypothetical protein
MAQNFYYGLSDISKLFSDFGDAPLDNIVNDDAGADVDIVCRGIQDDFRIDRRFIWGADAGEIGDLSGSGASIETFFR